MPSVALSSTELVVHKRRWFILFIVAGLNITNGALWISFSPISNLAASYYDVSSNAINWLSVVFFVAVLPFGIAATLVVNKLGLKHAMHIGAVLNALGAAIRILSTASFMPAHLHFTLTMTGQVLAAIAQPFIILLPTKVSETWFPEHQRTLSTSIAAMSNPIGVSLGSLLSPIIVTKPEQMFFMNVIWGSGAILFGPVTLLGIRQSAPPEAPSTSALEAKNHQPYLSTIKKLFKNKQYLVLCISCGSGIGAISCFMTMLQQMLCPKGYSNNFSGLCGALTSFVGIIGATISGILADRTKKFEELAKFSITLSTLAGIAMAVSFHWPRTDLLEYIIGSSSALFGLFGFAAYPLFLELSVECTYPIDESLSSGFIIISGQIQGIIYVLLLSTLGGPLSAADQAIETCTEGINSGIIEPQDMTVPALVFAGIIVGTIMLFVLLFKAKYKRMNVESLRLTHEILDSGEYERLSNVTPRSYS